MAQEEIKRSYPTFWMAKKVTYAMQSMCGNLNKSFNSLSIQARKAGLLAVGSLMGSISLTLVVQGIKGDQNHNELSISPISTPNDIYMNEEERNIHEEQLIPVGKLKGEIDGEFEAFYLAVDKAGQTYINRSLDYSDNPYHKSKGWEPINQKELKRFEANLHFIPIKSKGLKH